MGWLKSIRRGATWASLGIAGGAVAVTVRHLLQTPQPLESVLRGETHIDRKHGGDLYYNLAGRADAPAVVLLHDFYPGASNFEFRAVFESLAHDARVYAPDWLGFGMSERPNLAYTGEFYANSLTGFLRDVVQRPATVIAHGLAANVAARAASDAPRFFERLVLVSPVVLAGEGPEPTLVQAVAHTAQRFSLGMVPYAMIATRPMLKRLAGGPAADEERVDHLYASAHQFGAHFAPLALLAGELDLPIRNVLPLLEPPLLIVSGEQDPRRSRETMEDLAVLNPHADLDVIPRAGEMVFEDQPGAFVAAVTAWIGAPASRHLIDESALLPDDEQTSVPAATTDGDEQHAATLPGAGDTAEQQVGSPGYVVPGVSDMGLDALAVVTEDGVANLEPEPSSVEAQAGDDSAYALLPEAGEAGPGAPQDEDVENIADFASDERAETPTKPRKATRVSATTAPEPPTSSPEMRTSAASRRGERAKSSPATSRQSSPKQQPSAAKQSKPAPRTAGTQPAGRSNNTKGTSSRKSAGKSRGDPR